MMQNELGNDMNNALKRFTPSTNWISAGLLTLMVVSFGIAADRHARTQLQTIDFTSNVCETDEAPKSQSLSFIRFH